MLNSIKTFFQNPKVQSELHSSAVTFFTVFLAMLSTGVSAGNFSQEAMIAVVVAAARAGVKAVYQSLVSEYTQK